MGFRKQVLHMLGIKLKNKNKKDSENIDTIIQISNPVTTRSYHNLLRYQSSPICDAHQTLIIEEFRDKVLRDVGENAIERFRNIYI